MDPDKVMEDPVDIEALLEALFLFGIGRVLPRSV
jgi:hypothetical protein